VVIWKEKTGFRYHYSSAPSKLVSLCGSLQLPPWHSNINHGYKPYTVVAKRDTTERPHTKVQDDYQNCCCWGILVWTDCSMGTVL